MIETLLVPEHPPVRRALERVVLPPSLQPPRRVVGHTLTARGSLTLCVLRALENGWSPHPTAYAEEIDQHRVFFHNIPTFDGAPK